VKQNLAGRIAAYFLRSKLTPALVAVIAVWGLFAVFATPRQENPQITMPAAIIVTQYPGASAQEVQRLITERGERVLQQVAGIEHIYAVSNQNVSIMTVLFHVGDDPTKSFVDLYDHIYAHLDELPPGAMQPKITPVSVDDLPIVTLTLHGARYNRGQLETAAERLIDAIQPIPGVSTIDTYGGRTRQVDVTVDPVKLAAYGLSPLQIAQALGSTDVIAPVGSLRSGTTDVTMHAGTPYSNVTQVAAQIVGVADGHPIALSQVADVRLSYTPADDNGTLYANGPAAKSAVGVNEPAVTIAIAKKTGTNAVDIANQILKTAAATELPPGIAATVTRNDGAKANDAVNELIERLIEAIVIVVLLLLVLGWREAIVVATAIPLTLFVTLGTGMLTGQTINRITLFALILGLGLLVDQAIVIVENIHRHYHEDPGASKADATVRAVAEIGSPTTLATLTVVLSFLPMLFVTGMMGPYMRPIPINVPVAMIASLLIAFAITPWATYALLRNQKAKTQHGIPRWIAPFRNALKALLESPVRARLFLGGLVLALLVSIALPVLTLVKFRMLPDANQTTFLVSVDAPPASSIAETTRIARAVGEVLARTPEVLDYETFVGTNAVPDLSSLLQGTIFRNSPNQADIRVNLVPKGERKIQSPDLARKLRPQLQAAAARYGATLRILQTPPGPPVRDTILAKIYGPNPEVRRAIASRVVGMMQREPGVVDIDSSYKPLPLALTLEVDQRKAALSGVDAATIAQTLGMALHGASVSTLHVPSERRPVGIVVRFASNYRRDAASLGSIMLPSRAGGLVPLSSVTKIVAQQAAQPLYRDDYSDASYVGADMAGRSSTYAVIDFLIELAHHPLPAGYRIDWGGEWHLTLTVFADLGRAMLIAFVLIYFVLVARFRSFRTPLVVLAAVPLALLGVLPGFAILAPFGVYFSATAMIGVIALIGIVVRNSIILIEFIEDKIAEGLPLRTALVEATTARTRPIFLTAAAGVLSSVVIAADPVWSGLAWALVFGMSASAVLSVLAIPLLYLGVAESKPTTERGALDFSSFDHPVDEFAGFDA
jgi:multidrug efflux pump subunit AcrB